MEKSEFLRVSRLARSIAGLNLPEEKAPLVKSRLQRRLDVLDFSSVGAYCDFIESGDGHSEIDDFISVLTTNVTRFFREPHHFEHFKSVVLPRIVAEKQINSRFRVWSCACSTGAEPYSIAAYLAAANLVGLGIDVRVLATDIDASALKFAQAAKYPPPDAAAIPPDLNKYFVQNGPDFVSPSNSLRDLVSIKRLDLTKKWPFSTKFDTVFCRNVVIYFDEDVTESIWHRLAGVIERGGYLYTGHSERVSGIATEYFDLEAITTYRRNEKAFNGATI